jgi:hypothetical protein
MEPALFDLERETPGSQGAAKIARVNRRLQSPVPAMARFRSARSEISAKDDAIATDDQSLPEASIAPNAPDPERRRLAEAPVENSRSEYPASQTNGAQRVPDWTHPTAPRVTAVSRLPEFGGDKAEPVTPDHDEISVIADSTHHSPHPAQTNLVRVRSSPARLVAARPSTLAATSQSLPAASAINVTIGRVEVRATLPPTAAQTPRRNSPIVSLDEYLRQRAKGAGR